MFFGSILAMRHTLHGACTCIHCRTYSRSPRQYFWCPCQKTMCFIPTLTGNNAAPHRLDVQQYWKKVTRRATEKNNGPSVNAVHGLSTKKSNLHSSNSKQNILFPSNDNVIKNDLILNKMFDVLELVMGSAITIKT